ncbi:carbohydrate binding domain-containing protein [Streptomyces anulatus]|uniref:carbohydrate binding domain-containing protein n=1 Tax=Streptomyces anulatus TaxID=1892 RepID=UPI001D18209E|nr:carbohydrate binding domain-containing protein [Streptomyces anulatus]
MPSLPPPRTTELFYGGAWHTAKVRESSPLTITRGVSAEGTTADPSAGSLVLDNRDGAAAPRNPHSPLYGEAGRNTPIRHTVTAGPPWLNLTGTTTSRLATPHAATLNITGDLDLSMELAAASWRQPQMLAARYSTTGENRIWILELAESGALILIWSPDGTFANRRDVTSTAPVPAYNGQRLAVRVVLDVNNGAGGHTVYFYTGLTTAGPWTVLGAPVTVAGTTQLRSGTAAVEIGRCTDFNQLPNGGLLNSLTGRVYGLRLRDGIGGPLRIDLQTGTQAAVGASTVTDATGRTWTRYSTSSFTNRHVRLEGEVPAWPPSRDMSGADRTVAITPAGILRRLGAGTRPLDSALRRFLTGNPPAECWPLTDGPSSTQGAAMFGSAPILPAGGSWSPPKWAGGELAEWIEPVALCPEQTEGLLTAAPRTAGTSSWSVDICRSGYGWNEFLDIRGRAAYSTTWQLIFQPVPDRIMVTRTTQTDTGPETVLITTINNPGIFDDNLHHVRFTTIAGGSNTAWVLYLDGKVALGSSEPVTARAIDTVSWTWTSTSAPDTDDVAVGYLTCWNASPPSAAAVYQAALGFPGEAAGTRVARLSAENGVPVSISGAPDMQTLLGTQRRETYLDALDQIARTDHGILFERRDARELVYRARSTLYNQQPVLTLDWSTGVISEPFRPIDDDKLTENDVTVKREGGTSATAVLEQGRMSVLDPPDGVGRYDENYTLSLATDHQTGEHAQWRMHLGTFDGLRFTKITLNLANPRVYALIDDIYRADVGDLMRLTNLPDDYGPGDVDLIIRGYTEEISADRWTLTFNCGPGAPWQVGVVEDPVLGRADTDGSQLASAATTSATSLSVAVTAGPRWITAAPNILPDPGFETGTGQWECTRGTNIGVVSWERDLVRTGTGALRVTRVHPTDTGTMNLRDPSGIVPAAAGQTWAGSAWVYAGGAATNAMRVALVWRTSGGTETYVYGAAPGTPPGSWQQLTVSATLPTGAVDVRLGIEGRSSWTVGEWWQADDIRLARTDNLVGDDLADQFPFSVTLGGEEVTVLGISGTSSPQTFTVARSANGITKGHSTATPLSLTYPMRAAL